VASTEDGVYPVRRPVIDQRHDSLLRREFYPVELKADESPGDAMGVLNLDFVRRAAEPQGDREPRPAARYARIQQ